MASKAATFPQFAEGGRRTGARPLRAAHVSDQLAASVLDLARYELGNVLCTRLGWAAAAAEFGTALVSADRQLQSAGLAESPAQVVRRLRLAPARGGRRPPTSSG